MTNFKYIIKILQIGNHRLYLSQIHILFFLQFLNLILLDLNARILLTPKVKTLKECKPFST